MSGFYELPRTRHMPSPAWSDLIVRTLIDIDAAGVDKQLNEWISQDRDHVNVLAITPPQCVVADNHGESWWATLMYQKRLDPNGGQS